MMLGKMNKTLQLLRIASLILADDRTITPEVAKEMFLQYKKEHPGTDFINEYDWAESQGLVIQDIDKSEQKKEISTEILDKLEQEFYDAPYWDVDGIGEVPDQKRIDYLGFVKRMSPKEFRRLVPPGSMSDSGREFAKKVNNEGAKLAPPFLEVNWNNKDKSWEVWNHEGRSRSDAAYILDDIRPIPVHIFPVKGIRNRDLTEEMLEAPFVPQEY